MSIEWIAFLEVFVAAMLGAIAVVFFYALALRLLVRAGAVPVVAPAGGYVSAILVELNQIVQEGDGVVEIDDTPSA